MPFKYHYLLLFNMPSEIISETISDIENQKLERGRENRQRQREKERERKDRQKDIVPSIF